MELTLSVIVQTVISVKMRDTVYIALIIPHSVAYKTRLNIQEELDAVQGWIQNDPGNDLFLMYQQSNDYCQ